MKTEAEIESLLGWWRDAGVDIVVGDTTRSWLEVSKPRKSKAEPVVGKASENATQPLQMPANLSEFQQWLLASEAVPGATDDRVAAVGDPASGLMILVDMPENTDAKEGRLLSGDAGRLLDRMLGAIGRDRNSVYLAAMSPARISRVTSGDSLATDLATIARRHVALAAPECLLTMGDAPSRVFCEANLAEARGRQHYFNHEGGIVSVIATFHPRFLLQQPKLKAESWKDLQMLVEGMNA